MTSLKDIQDSYAALKGRISTLAPSALIRRDLAVQNAASLGFPNTRVEDWKYSSLKNLLDKGFHVLEKSPKTETASADLDHLQAALLPNSIRLVFIDGELSIGMSDTRKCGNQVLIKTLFEAESLDEGKWKHWDTVQGMDRVFSQLAVGFAGHGVCVSVAPRAEVSNPIHVLHITTPALEGVTSSQRCIFDIGRLAQVDIVEEFVTIGPTAFHTNSLSQVLAGDGSLVSYSRVDGSNHSSFHTSQVVVTVGRDAKVNTFSLVSGTKFTRVNIDVAFTDPGGECTLDGIYLVTGNQHIDHHTAVDHAVTQCLSRQLYKGIVTGSGRAVFNGKVHIGRGASQTQAYQTNKTLLLSVDGEVDTKPELLIENDDVKASHGATVGALDPQELHYLQTRAIGRAEAESLLCKGFVNEVAANMEHKDVKELLYNRIDAWFSANPIKSDLNQ